MIEDITIAEKQQIDVVAQEYMDKGYKVTRDVVLDFLPNFRVDLVVEKGDKTTVVEVKTATSLARDPNRDELSRLVASMPGWNLELILVPEPERLGSHEGARPFNRADIVDRLAKAEQALDAGLPEAATLSAWSASEATVRLLLRQEGIAINRITNSAYTVGRAVSEGAISWDDYVFFQEAQKYRNEIVHGFGAGGRDVRHLARNLIEMTRRLLQQLSDPEVE